MRHLSRLFALLGVIASGSACSKTALTTGDAMTDTPPASNLDSRTDVAQGSEAPPDASLTPPADITFPDPPRMSCGGAGDCQLPPSACADPGRGSQWVVYFDSPTCVSGQCVFTKRYFQCGPSTACFLGGCSFNGTV